MYIENNFEYSNRLHVSLEFFLSTVCRLNAQILIRATFHTQLFGMKILKVHFTSTMVLIARNLVCSVMTPSKNTLTQPTLEDPLLACLHSSFLLELEDVRDL